jgi:hypothetical protein
MGEKKKESSVLKDIQRASVAIPAFTIWFPSIKFLFYNGGRF